MQTLNLEVMQAKLEVEILQARLRLVPASEPQLATALRTSLRGKAQRLAQLQSHAVSRRAF